MIPKRLVSLLIISLLAAGLAACTSKEEKSQARFREARQEEIAGRTDAAEKRYREIVADYPGTPGAVEAATRIDAIELARHLALQKAALPLFKTVGEVVQGYASMYGRMPQSIADLDDERFFFDSSYLVDGIPAGFNAWLSLREDSEHGGYRIWAVPAEGNVGFHVDGSGRGLIMAPKKEILGEIEREYSEELRKGRMTFLVPGGSARAAKKGSKGF